MIEKDQDLGEVDSEHFEFPPPERRIVTQPYDLSLNTLREQWEQKELVVPEMQREYVWDNGRASRLIESLLLNIPVPPVYFAERDDSVLEVVDGHQRVHSIVRFLSNEFPLSGLGILSEYLRNRFHELPPREQRFLKSRSLRAVVIGRDSHPNMKFEVFERLNTGGVALNAQELRNSLYRGSLNKLLRRVAKECTAFRTVIGGKKARKRMVDEELILRWLAFRDNLQNYRAPLKRFLNEYMSKNKDRGVSWLDSREEHFSRTMSLVEQVLGEQAFRLIDESGEALLDTEGKPLPRGVNRALFDAQAIAFSWARVESVSQAQKAELIRQISKALGTEELQDASRRATGDKARVRLRIELMVGALRAGGLELDIPSRIKLREDVNGSPES